MCGELDEGLEVDNEIFARLQQLARHQGVALAGSTATVPDLEEAAGRSAYMDTLFAAGLTRAVGDATAAQEGQRTDAIAAQAIVFARLAGFLAGNLPPEADLFRTAIEALTDGHAMPGRIAEHIRRDHDHHHGHDHDDHGH